HKEEGAGYEDVIASCYLHHSPHSHFPRPPLVRADIEKKVREMERRSDSGTEEILVAIGNVHDMAQAAFGPLLDRQKQVDRIRSVQGLLLRFRTLFNLPAVMRGFVQHGEYDRAVHEYLKAKSISLPAHSNILRRVMAEVHKVVAEFHEVLFAKMDDPNADQAQVGRGHIGPRGWWVGHTGTQPRGWAPAEFHEVLFAKMDDPNADQAQTPQAHGPPVEFHEVLFAKMDDPNADQAQVGRGLLGRHMGGVVGDTGHMHWAPDESREVHFGLPCCTRGGSSSRLSHSSSPVPSTNPPILLSPLDGERHSAAAGAGAAI
ncbi:unnamed protein product, partial [Closterium sp. NIES-53]